MAENGTAVATTQPIRLSLIETMAHEYGMEAKPFLEAIQQTVMPGSATTAQIAAFLQVAHEYNLNPFIKEIYAFPTKGGGIAPVVAVDGWIFKITSHPEFKGMEKPIFELDERGKIISCTITAHRKDWDSPIVVQEWFDECYRNTDPWNKMPHRMMRNRTMCQVGRIGFGIHGIMTQDEADEINITSQSTEMERTTNTKAEQLKEKIGAKKASTPAAKAEPVVVVVEPQPEPPAPVVVEEMPPAAEDDLGLSEPSPVIVDENGDKPISEEQRGAFLTILKTRAVSDAQKALMQKMTRQFLFNLGYTKTAEVKVKDFKGLMEWANSVEIK